MEKLLDLLHGIHPLSADLTDHLATILKKRTFLRKELIQREGQIAHHIYFIEKGLVRGYHVKNGKEVSSWFMKEGDILVSVPSFFSQQPSHQAMEALEDCVVWGISYQQIQAIYKAFPEFNLHRAIILEKYYGESEMRNHLTLMQSALDKYADLMNVSPELVNRVPSKYLASYLGVSEGTLSTIRAKFLNRKQVV